MRYSLMFEGQEGVTWEEWLAAAQTCERLGLEGLVSSDHYFPTNGSTDRGSSDAWTVMAALAARTERIRLGTLVSPVTFRHPAHLAKVVATVDRISGGRVDLGMGAGWWEEEHATHGLPFPPTVERFERLEEQLEIVQGLFTQDPFAFEGTHYRLERGSFFPKPVQRPHPPIVIGGAGGRWLTRLIVRWADEFNTVSASPSVAKERFERVRSALDEAGRGQQTLTTSVMTWCYVGATEAQWRARVERAKQLDPELDDAWIDETCVFGTPDRAAERIRAFADAGAQRIVLNHSLFDDLDMIELLAAEVFPLVEN
ncbi:MAG: TIGR03560 family F420-dependent LLM class oxidoreductase [Actinomycetota bacterium]